MEEPPSKAPENTSSDSHIKILNKINSFDMTRVNSEIKDQDVATDTSDNEEVITFPPQINVKKRVTFAESLVKHEKEKSHKYSSFHKNELKPILLNAYINETLGCTTNRHSTILFTFNGTYMGQPVRILVDSGSTVDLVSDRIHVPYKTPFHKERIELVTGSGTIKQHTKVFDEQPIRVQGNDIHRKLKQVNIGDLPFDIILGMPFLCDYDPHVAWRAGTLRFKKFTWVANKDLFAGIHALASTVFAQELESGADLIILCATQDEQDDVDKAISSSLTENQRKQMRKLILRYKNSDSIGSEKDNLPHFDDMRPKPKHWHMDIKLNDNVTAEPHARPRPMSPKEMEELKRQLTFLLSHGFIKRSSSRYASPTLFAKKKDGTLRWCCDYRVLNEKTLAPSSPLPRIDTLIDKLSKAKYFTALDLIQGYHQLPLNPNDTWKTAITTPFGLFEWRVVPFGLSGAPSHFQTVMTELFGPLSSFGETVLNLLDDLLIYTDTWEEHIAEVERVLNVLEQHEFYINFRKCSFAQEDVVYVGQRIGRGIRRPDPSKVEALLKHPLPTTATELRSFLGLANYLAPYIPQYSKIIEPFSTHRALPKRTRISLGSDHRYAMKQLREAFCTEPVLQLPDFEKRFYLQVDASKVGIGTALLQKHGEQFLPVAYQSRLLTTAQKRWPIHDLELYAIVDAMKHFRTYLLDKPFTVLSDHKPLIHLKHQKDINMRQLRYLDTMAMYQFDIQYLPGKDNLFADWLSRPPGEYIHEQDVRPTFEQSRCRLCQQQTLDEVVDKFDVGSGIPKMPYKQVYTHTCKENTKSKKAELATLAAHVSFIHGTDTVDIEQVKTASKTDTFCSKVIEVLTNTSMVNHHYRDKYIYHEELLYLRPVHGEVDHRLCIPDVKDIREAIIKLHHDTPTSGHRDCDTTYLAIRTHCFWPNMRAHVMRYVSTCDACLKHKSQHKKPAGFLHPIEHPAALPWHDVATDLATHLPPSRQAMTNQTFDAIQFYVCRLTKKIRCVPCKTTHTAVDLANLYYLNVFPVEGLPKTIVSDRDPKFTSAFWQQMGQCLGVKFKMSSAHRPQTDGLAENVVKVVKMLIRIFVNYSQNDWIEYLPMFEFCLNRTRVRGRGGTDKNNVTPFLLSNGYNPLSISDLTIPQPATDATLDYVRRKKIALALAQDTIIAAQDRIAEIYNAGRRIVNYSVDDFSTHR